MEIEKMTLHRYKIGLTTGKVREGVLIMDGDSWGEISPLPGVSSESLEEVLEQISKGDFSSPSAAFGLESLQYMPVSTPIPVSLLFMGTANEILDMADKCTTKRSVKVKVSQLSFKEAEEVINKLKSRFHLRIDVNRAWKTQEALEFFSRYPKDAFDYVEEPLQNPHDLKLFSHPLAVDESFPSPLSLNDLEAIPKLKALIYKPTIQGGVQNALPLKKWADSRGIDFIASSTFETDLGLAHVLTFSQMLGLTKPVGIGTYHYLTERVCDNAIQFLGSSAIVRRPVPSEKFLRENQHVIL